MRPGLRIQLIVDPALLALAVDDAQRALSATATLIEIAERAEENRKAAERLNRVCPVDQRPAALIAVCGILSVVDSALPNLHDLRVQRDQLAVAVGQSRSLADVPVMMPFEYLPLGQAEGATEAPTETAEDLPY